MLGEIPDRIMKYAAISILNAQAGGGAGEHTQPDSEAYRITRFAEAADPLLTDSCGASNKAIHWATARSMLPGERALDVEMIKSRDVDERRLKCSYKNDAADSEELADANSDLALLDALRLCGRSRHANLDRAWM